MKSNTSSQRKLGSRKCIHDWIPAFAGMTVVVFCSLFATISFANELEARAEKFAKEKQTAHTLAMTARLLDHLQDTFTEKYERACYWKKSAPRTPECMKKATKELNAKYGKDAFQYTGGISVAYIQYTGSHYQQILKRYKKSEYAAEAEFYLLLLDLRGDPDQVMAKAKDFLDTHTQGEWHRKALLLWGRLNEDISFVWRKWTWVVYNGSISDDELIIRSEPYRLAAVAAFEALVKKHPGTFEAKAAAEDLKKLNTQGDDGLLYSITNDASAVPWSRWGITVQ